MEKFFKELVENSDDIYLVVDKDFRIRYISSVVRRYGAEPLALLGKSIFEFADSSQAAIWHDSLAQVNDRKIFDVALKIKGDEPFYFDVTVFKINQTEVEGGRVLQLHDITAHKRKAQELNQSNQQLDQVIYKTTHDLRAPLMSALGLLSLAEQAPDAQRLEYLTLLRRSLNKLNAFIEEMHHFYRTGKMAIQVESINWDELIQEELNDHRMTYHPEKVSIEVSVHQPLEFWSDRLRVKTILTNLVTNAIKYADVSKPHHLIQISVAVNDHEAVLVVKDNGIGIEKQYHDKIFDMFFRATTVAHGTGLGLFILRDTVQKLKGKITLEAEPGKGSTFTVCLPNRKAEARDKVEDIRAGSRSFS